MHSGMRGGPHVGALRRRSFTEYGELLQAESTSVFRKAICCLASNRSKGDFVSVRCNCGLSVPDRPDDKTHTLADLRRFGAIEGLMMSEMVPGGPATGRRGQNDR